MAKAPANAPVLPRGSGPTLNDAQDDALTAVIDAAGQCRRLPPDGVTGSGKTEVYLRLAGESSPAAGSVLVLCPEIGLTPQLVDASRARFDGADGGAALGPHRPRAARCLAPASSGAARIVIGTRSAVFAPCPRLGLIIVDEEHDSSYKQQEGGFRYSARDLACCVAARAGAGGAGLGHALARTLHNVVPGG